MAENPQAATPAKAAPRTRTRTAPSAEITEKATGRKVELVMDNPTKTFAKFSVPADEAGVRGSIYCPPGTKGVRILIIT